jgi:glycosyltransferase involved in cell wall biosynthesis
MRIGVVTTSYPRTAGEAAGSFVAAQVAALRAAGHDVDVIAAGEPIAHGEAGVTRVPATGLFYAGGAPEALERRDPGSVLAAAAFTARLTAELARRAHRWDQLIAHWLAPSALAALSARRPLLAIAHGGDVHTLRRWRLLAPALAALRARDARLAFVSDDLLAIARAAAPRLARWLAARAIVQPMGLDVTHFARLGRAPISPAQLVIAARLVPIKGVDVALAAMAALRSPAQLVIAGDGPERAALERTAAALAPEVGARVRFVGEVEAARRDALLRGAAAVLVPSRVLPSGRAEGTPLIALEALAAGVPVIASATGGLRALPVVRVPPDDPRALAEAIERVLAAPPPRVDIDHLDHHAVTDRLLAHARGG